MKNKNKKVVIVGGGFGGLSVAKRLLSFPVDVTLIDISDRFTFTPLLVELATNNLTINDVSFTYQDFFKKTNVHYIHGAVHSVDLDKQLVFLNQQSLAYV